MSKELSVKAREFLHHAMEKDTLLKDKMHKACQISIVIPLYGERDVFLRPLHSLTHQDGVETDQYEVIFVVFNSEQPPHKEENEAEGQYQKRLDYYHKALRKNKEMLRILSDIHKHHPSKDVSVHDHELISDIIESGIQVHVIDKSSAGKTLSVGGNLRTKARNRGVAEAIKRFHTNKKDGLIIQADADIRFDKHYLFNAIKLFNQETSLAGASGRVIFELHGNNLQGYSNLRLYSDLYMNYLDAVRNFSLQFASQIPGLYKKNKLGFCGSNIISRAYATAEAQGVPQEEGTFAEQLMQEGDVVCSEHLLTYPIDEVIERQASSRAQFKAEVDQEGTVHVFHPKSLFASDNNYSESIPIEKAVMVLVHLLKQHDAYYERYQLHLGRLVDQYRYQTGWYKSLFDKITRTFFEMNPHPANKDRFMSVFTLHYADQHFYRDEIDFLQCNQQIVHALLKILRESESVSEAHYAIQNAFLHLLTDPVDDERIMGVLELRAMVKVLGRGVYSK